MRLAAVRERDPDLDRLLRLAAVMAGSFTSVSMLRVWRVLALEDTLGSAIQRGTTLGFIKFLTASGNTGGARRRSSAGAGAQGRYVFSHLRILDNVLELLLRCARPTTTHLVCAFSAAWGAGHLARLPWRKQQPPHFMGELTAQVRISEFSNRKTW